ncbi:Glycine betaine transport system permease protein OpuAB [Sulfitobacter noctilucicola]|uniref:ABC-type proline/glycine betaine transport system permease subunit n=1 Tax=Sulfitobacter noctilucicola TaxID=1342301 RepID=A0A7W6MBQ4_9RHOB|nr:Glycine betaine transport system permease protein OpuAB [Sulfitobacter noctilucicola]MBB4175146.1 ABC-type proline/glycine betaine transport system permease subunit [Sulfitobacter noctilucicola]
MLCLAMVVLTAFIGMQGLGAKLLAMVPLTRYTTEGLRSLPEEMTEAADMSGATRM